jgi:hypothetical protein
MLNGPAWSIPISSELPKCHKFDDCLLLTVEDILRLANTHTNTLREINRIESLLNMIEKKMDIISQPKEQHLNQTYTIRQCLSDDDHLAYKYKVSVTNTLKHTLDTSFDDIIYNVNEYVKRLENILVNMCEYSLQPSQIQQTK